MEDDIMEQISNEQILKEISEEMIELETKIAKWNTSTDSLQMIEEWMEREEELICFRFEVVEGIKKNRG